MKKLFTAIQKNDLETVKSLLNKSPELISCTLKGTPKKYDGQSPLQVALKESNNQMIELLLTYNPNVNFIEDVLCANLWRTPVIHDAINRAIMYSRWNVKRADGLEVFNDEKSATESFCILEKLIKMGADVNAKDSFGNSCIGRACLQASQILPTNNNSLRVLTPELCADIEKIFNLLIKNGADLNYVAPNFGTTYIEQYKDTMVGKFLLKGGTIS